MSEKEKKEEEKCLTCVFKEDKEAPYGAKFCSQGHMIEVFLEESRTWRTDFSGCDSYKSISP